MTDAQLVEAALAGDQTGLAVLLDRHAPACLRFATRMLGSIDDAEDATQEAFVRAFRALSRYDAGMSFRTWLMTILINRCRSMLLHRRRRTSRVIVDNDLLNSTHATAREPDADLHDALERALRRLEPPQREAFLLKHVECLTYDEMAAVTGVGVSALKMRVQRACERLQALLGDDQYV